MEDMWPCSPITGGELVAGDIDERSDSVEEELGLAGPLTATFINSSIIAPTINWPMLIV